eukprot:scaffold6712_cov142-Cylindrotheca_fusiformis.AAC.8
MRDGELQVCRGIVKSFIKQQQGFLEGLNPQIQEQVDDSDCRMVDHDSGRSAGSSAVFDRLYSKQTAASIGHRMRKDEEEARRRKEEEDEFAKCTFSPRTKWDIALERRRKAQEQVERAQHDSPSKPASRTDGASRQTQELELTDCTFKPRTKWSLASERRELARKQRERAEYDSTRLPHQEKKLSDREIRDRKREEEELKYCTFKPTLVRNKKVFQTWKPNPEDEASLAKGDIEPDNKLGFEVDHHTPIATNKKSTENTAESKDERLNSQVESKSSGGSTVPEWKRKYDNERKQHEVVVSAQGRHAPSEAMHVRGASIISQAPVKRTIRGVSSKPPAVEAGAELVEPKKDEAGDSSNVDTLPPPHRRDPSAATGSNKLISDVEGFRVASAKQEEAAGSADAGECRVIPQGGSHPQAMEITKLDNGGFRVAQNLDLQSAETSSKAKKASKWKDRLRDKRSRSDSRPQEADKSSCTADEVLVEGTESALAAKDKQENVAEEEAEHAAKEEQEKLAEQEQLAQEEAERAAKEEQDRLAQEEAERAAKEEQEKLAQEEAA